MKKTTYLIIILFASFLSACKKDKTTNTNLDAVKDSVYYFPTETYLWYDQLPTYSSFQPRKFSGKDDITKLTNEVNKLSQYAINPSTSLPYEYYEDDPGEAKYSFIDDGSVSDELGGSNADFGFGVLYQDVSDLRIKYVYAGSPAGLAGIKRGDQITKINGRTDFDYDDGPNVQFVINAYAYSKTISMSLLRSDQTTYDVTLNAVEYNVNPVLTYKVFDEGNGKKVGYIVFNTFTAATNAGPKIQEAFSYFSSHQITDLVADLRYNGGGRTETAELLDDYIVPPAKDGSLMYTSFYNDKLQNDNIPLLRSVYDIPQGYFSTNNQKINFSKIGSLNLNRVFFIVTGATASASELAINNLIPHMDVELIGKTSYGKPVGFIDIPINKYELYMPMFSTRNSANKGDYYSGMTPGSTDYPGKEDYDDVSKDFGDSTETLLDHALHYVKYGTYSASAPDIQRLSKRNKTLSDRQVATMTFKLDEHRFKGMVKKDLNFKRR